MERLSLQTDITTDSPPDRSIHTPASATVDDRDEATHRDNGSRQKIDEPTVRAGPRICLLGADYDNSNLGIRALATGASTAIDAQFPGATVQMLEYGSASREFTFDLPSKVTRIEMLNIRFSKKPWLRNHIARLIASALFLKLVPSPQVRSSLGSRNPWLQALVKADYVLSLNYGDSFSDIYGLQRFVYVLCPRYWHLSLASGWCSYRRRSGPSNRESAVW